MCPEDEIKQNSQDLPLSIERLLDGLWRQREDLGLIAEELLDIFESNGLLPPQREESAD
jgi:hypothetical protein